MEKVCTIQMKGDLLERLNRYAEQEERSKSFVFRKALEKYLEEMEEDDSKQNG